MGDIDHLTDPWGIPSRGHDEDEEREMELLNSTPPSPIMLNEPSSVNGGDCFVHNYSRGCTIPQLRELVCAYSGQNK
eukprot:5212135-Pyramimonas_sp.AAC.1